MNNRIHWGHDSRKRYFECYAKLILETFLPEKYKDLRCEEKPDLRMGTDHGIEVSRAMFEGDGKASDIFDRIRDRHIDSVSKVDLQKLEDLKYEVLTFNGGIILGMSPMLDGVIDGREFKRIYKQKLVKFQNYSEVKTVDLFVYSPVIDWYEENLVRELMTWISEQGECPYKTVMIFEVTRLYVMDVRNKHLDIVPVRDASRELLVQCGLQAYKYATGEDYQETEI